MPLPQIMLPGLAIDDPSITANWPSFDNPQFQIKVHTPVYLWKCVVTASAPAFVNTLGPYTPGTTSDTYYADIYEYDLLFTFSLVQIAADDLIFNPNQSAGTYWPMNPIIGSLDTVAGPSLPYLYTTMAAQGITFFGAGGPYGWAGGPLYPLGAGLYMQTPISYSSYFASWAPRLASSSGFVTPFVGIDFSVMNSLGVVESTDLNKFINPKVYGPFGPLEWQFSIASDTLANWGTSVASGPVTAQLGVNPWNLPSGKVAGVGTVVAASSPLPTPTGSDTGAFVHVNLTDADNWNAYLTNWPTPFLNYLQYRFTVGDVLMTLSNDQVTGTPPAWSATTPKGLIKFSDYCIGGTGAISLPSFTISAKTCGGFCYHSGATLPSPPTDPFNGASLNLPGSYFWDNATYIFISGCSKTISGTVNPFQPVSQTRTLLNLQCPAVQYGPTPPSVTYPADTVLAMSVTETTTPYATDITQNFRTVMYVDPSYEPSVTASGPPRIPKATSFFPGDKAMALCGVTSGSFEKSMMCLKTMSELDPWGIVLAPYFWRSSDIDAVNNTSSNGGMPFLSQTMSTCSNFMASFYQGSIGGFPVWCEPRGSYMTWNGVPASASILYPASEPVYDPANAVAWFTAVKADDIWSQIKWGTAEMYIHKMLNPSNSAYFRGIPSFTKGTMARLPVLEGRMLASDFNFPSAPAGDYGGPSYTRLPPPPSSPAYPNIMHLTAQPSEAARFDQSYGPTLSVIDWTFPNRSGSWASSFTCPPLNVQGGQIAGIFTNAVKAVVQDPSSPSRSFPHAVAIGPAVVMCAEDYQWFSISQFVAKLTYPTSLQSNGSYNSDFGTFVNAVIIRNPPVPIPYWYPGGTSPYQSGPVFKDYYGAVKLTIPLSGSFTTAFGSSWPMIMALNNLQSNGSMIIHP